MVSLMLAACDSDMPTTPSNPNTGPIVFTSQLSAANEVPPIGNADADGRGAATLTFNVTRNPTTGAIIGGGSATFQVTLRGFPPATVVRNAHIHTGVAGATGTVLIDTLLTPTLPVTLDATGAGTLNLTNPTILQGDVTAIAANPSGYYFDVHTTLNPNGAARGQLVRE
jgi:hypothetical protein